ncbi:MAG TPA: glycosyltransferase family 87 protein [Anaerolineales bacterium]|nr:glycosyltransferase family 87 protein [Anaerolineales bacterium]
MGRQQNNLLRKAILALGIIVLAAAISQRALLNLSRIDYRNSNFVFFWLAGKMVDAGQNPYDTRQWIAQHDTNAVTWRPNQIFPYPLTLALLLAPLGVLSLEMAYVAWQITSFIIVAASAWAVLRSSGNPNAGPLFFPFVLGLLFFGPLYLTLQIGALGAFTLGAVTAGVLALDRRRDLLGGVLLSLVMLKPPLGLPIVLLAGVWLVMRRCWMALIGISAGSTLLLLAGLFIDPGWPGVFVGSAGDGIATRSLGLHSTVFSMAHIVCASGGNYQWLLGALAALLLGLAAGAYLWRRRLLLTHLEAFSVIIPIAFVSAVYAWSYDQVLYVLPIAWILGRWAKSPRGTLGAAIFGLLTIAVSLTALAIHAYTGSDLLSGLTSLLVLAGVGLAELAPQTTRPSVARA